MPVIETPEAPSSQEIGTGALSSVRLPFIDRAWEFLRPGVTRPRFMAWPLFLRDVWRISWRSVAMVVWMLLIYCAWASAKAALRSDDIRLRPVRRRILRAWGRGALRIMGMRLEAKGTLPEPPAFLVSNHLGLIDIVALSATTGCVFIAKADMADWPIFGRMMQSAQQLFIRRGDNRDTSRALAAVSQVYEESDIINVFAEARCTSGKEVMQFKPSLFEAPARGGWPVHYAALSYRAPAGEPAASDSIAWWRWEPLQWQFARMLRLPKGSVATLRFCEAPVPPANRKLLAAAACAGVRALFEPLEQGVLVDLPAPPDAPKNIFTELRERGPAAQIPAAAEAE